jgi:gliding motility-associated-like protein
VTVYPSPQAGFDVEPNVVELLTPNVTITSGADANTVVNYYFSDGGSLSSANGEYAFGDGGTFDIIQTVISPQGCIATAEGEVVVNGTIFYAPSGFTPDGDYLNDVWMPVALGVTSYQMEVRNRWGELFWSTDDPTMPWLGQKAAGEHFAPNGVYVWQVTYRDQLGFPVMKQGTVSLLR